MNFFNIISHLAEVDSDVMGRLDSRRAVFSSLTTAGKRVSQAAVPAMLASFFSKAYAGTSATIGDPKEVFNYALTLELLEADFYQKMIASAGFATASPASQAAIRQISKHEDAHVALLKAVVLGLGGTPVTGVAFSTTVFNTVTANFLGQLGVAQLLEDTGVRAYKGRAGDLQGLPDITVGGKVYNPLETALQIHSVEARHASHIRYMRTTLDPTATATRPWITGDGDQDTKDNYKGATPESNVIQSNVNITTGLGTTYTAKDAQASFDEILTVNEVVALITPLKQ